jgi:hypothetical protein
MVVPGTEGAEVEKVVPTCAVAAAVVGGILDTDERENAEAVDDAVFLFEPPTAAAIEPNTMRAATTVVGMMMPLRWYH